ncbi:MAG: type II toxin-antitoxin system VapC family toxin [Gammaproteobacteria bacterium]|nr:type II toxin-antitoxin system VapC family toxin [Gammaproteobacteria bacterium]
MSNADRPDSSLQLLLDTHALVWLDTNDEQLGSRCRTAADEALEAGRLAVSAITFWEVAMLASKGRLEMQLPVSEWRDGLLAHGLRELPIDGSIGVRTVELTGLPGDPADRFIIATCEVHQCTLATGDRRLLAWDSNLPRINARH